MACSNIYNVFHILFLFFFNCIKTAHSSIFSIISFSECKLMLMFWVSFHSITTYIDFAMAFKVHIIFTFQFLYFTYFCITFLEESLYCKERITIEYCLDAYTEEFSVTILWQRNFSNYSLIQHLNKGGRCYVMFFGSQLIQILPWNIFHPQTCTQHSKKQVFLYPKKATVHVFEILHEHS